MPMHRPARKGPTCDCSTHGSNGRVLSVGCKCGAKVPRRGVRPIDEAAAILRDVRHCLEREVARAPRLHHVASKKASWVPTSRVICAMGAARADLAGIRCPLTAGSVCLGLGSGCGLWRPWSLSERPTRFNARVVLRCGQRARPKRLQQGLLPERPLPPARPIALQLTRSGLPAVRSAGTQAWAPENRRVRSGRPRPASDRTCPDAAIDPARHCHQNNPTLLALLTDR